MADTFFPPKARPGSVTFSKTEFDQLCKRMGYTPGDVLSIRVNSKYMVVTFFDFRRLPESIQYEVVDV